MLQDMGDGRHAPSSAKGTLSTSQAVHELLGSSAHQPPSRRPADTESLFSPMSDPRAAASPAAGPSLLLESDRRGSNSPYTTSTESHPHHRDAHGDSALPRATQEVNSASGARQPRPFTPLSTERAEAYAAFAGQLRAREAEQRQREEEAKRLRQEAEEQQRRGHGTPGTAVTIDSRTGPFANPTRYNTANGEAAAATAQPGPTAQSGYSSVSPSSGGDIKRKKALGRFTKVGCLTVSFQWSHSIFLAVVVLLAGLIFQISVVPRGEIYSYVVTSVFMFLSLACLFLSVAVDPGIIPPAPRPAVPLQSEFVTINGTVVECKPCRTCHIIRPPRSSHCQFNDVCVEVYDHSCGVTGSCVAKRTYRFFGGFFVVTMVLCFYMFIRSVILLYQVRHTFQNSPSARWQFAAGVLCTIAGAMGGCFVIPFSFMYINMACLNTTQKEMLRRSAQRRVTLGTIGHGLAADDDGVSRPEPEVCGGQFARNYPYSRNPCLDCLTRFFGPMGSSKIKEDYYV